jgi:hypothetical protein
VSVSRRSVTSGALQLEDGSWTSQTERLLIMDSRDFNLVGIGLDDLIEVCSFQCSCLGFLCEHLVHGGLH